MFRIYNKHDKGAIMLPRAIGIPHKGSIKMGDAEWGLMSRHAVVASWLAAGVIVAKPEEESIATAEPVPDIAAVLAMADDGTPFPTFKAAASKLLGNETPSTKVDIIAALEAHKKPVTNVWK